jgi:hypothetical protein
MTVPLPPLQRRRLFNADGMEITDLMMIDDDAVVFVSGGSDFVPPGNSSGGGRGGADTDESGMPTLVGGFKARPAVMYTYSRC